MKKKNKSVTKIRYKCPDCGSVVKRDFVDGTIMEYCSQELIDEYKQYFTWFDDQDEVTQVNLMKTWPEPKHNMYSRWFIAKQPMEDPFACDWKLDNMAKLLSPSKCIITIPDTAQVMIAEAKLRRPLTENELTGRQHIPIINEDGTEGEGQIEHIRYPKDLCAEYKDMTEVYNPTPIGVIFKWEDL